ncbi:hypothetical protein [Stutzerimonas frequens]|uniref:hypothetical protein n=1 Tax=Stutzerimonas frequens TaxID=2968969 RepID=UPI0018CD3C0F|nr:hypothetical protein [Stutzerimonas frequens]
MIANNHAGQQACQDSSHTADISAAPSKIARILAYLLIPCNSLNRFEAEHLGDHCLPSTISTLTHSYNIQFQHQPERVPNRWAQPCTVTRYCLPETQREHARQVLARLSQAASHRREIRARDQHDGMAEQATCERAGE